ncbi:MAG TPA: metal ABC transporter permease [Solirubrobacterales bacterium]|nr:metal ABC transporter permease [Solirubrobacterales bacterium]
MSDSLVIVLTAGLVATACGLLGPLLVLRRQALMSDAVAHAVLPGIVLVFVLFATRAPLPVIAGAAAFGAICVVAVDALRSTGLVRVDAAIGIVFPALFALGVIGISSFASGAHIDLDATVYGEIAFAPFRTVEIAGVEVARSIPLLGAVALANLALLALLWKELKVTTFDPEFARTAGFQPRLVSRLLLVAVAVTAVVSFESVGAILVVTMLIVPAVAAYLVAQRLLPLIALTIAIGWVAAIGGYESARALDASIAGAMGLVASGCFVLALFLSPRYGVLARALQRRRRRSRVRRAVADA